MHEEYGHLSQRGMRDLVWTRAWWPKLDQDVQEFVKSCPNCQIAQRQRPGQDREYAQLPTPEILNHSNDGALTSLEGSQRQKTGTVGYSQRLTMPQAGRLRKLSQMQRKKL